MNRGSSNRFGSVLVLKVSLLAFEACLDRSTVQARGNMKTMFLKLGGRKSREHMQPSRIRELDEKTFTATVDLLEVFTKKSSTDTSFGTSFEAPAKDIDSVVSSVFNGEST